MIAGPTTPTVAAPSTKAGTLAPVALTTRPAPTAKT
jgi:hypothetical protein